MSLMRGKLFAGLLYAGLLLGGQGEQVPVTPEFPLSGGFGYARYQPENVIKHVQAHSETWQKQNTIAYASIAYEQPVFVQRTVAFGKSEQRQDSVGTFATTIPVQTPAIQQQIVSTHFAANVATAHVQATSGTVSVATVLPDILPDTATDKESLTVAEYASISILANANTQQQQGTSAVVSTHYPSAAVIHTIQQQATHGIVNATASDSQLAAAVLITKAASAQQQSTVGRVTTSDDEMLMVLLALMEMDDAA